MMAKQIPPLDAVKWIKENPDEALEIFEKYFGSETNEEVKDDQFEPVN